MPAGLPWLMPRLKHAKALHVGNQYGMYGVDTLIRPLREIVSMLLNGSSSLSELRVLVSHTSECAAFCSISACQAKHTMISAS